MTRYLTLCTCFSDAPLLHRASLPAKPVKRDPPVLDARLTVIKSEEKREMPVSFRIALEGKITLEITWPEALSRKGLATTATITVNSADWLISRNQLSSRWKSAAAMASKDALIWKGALPDQVPPVSTVAILQDRPLALRIALLRSGKTGREGFYVIGCNYRSEALNDSVRPDTDDLAVVVRIPTFGARDALIRQVPLQMPADEQSEQTLLISRTIRPCIPPADQPGAAMPTLHATFMKVLDAATKSGELTIIPSHLMKTPRQRRDDKTASGRRTSSSAYDTDGSSAAVDTSIKGKYSHTLGHFWFINSAPRGYREIFSSSISDRTAYHYGVHVRAWISHCTTEGRDPLSPSIVHLIEYLSARACAQPVSSLRMTISALRKFFNANLVSDLILDSPSIKALLVGLANKPRQSRVKTHRLAMNKASLTLAGHVLQSQEWPERDKSTIWSLFLVAYYASARIGDLVSSHANSASSKTLRWADVTLSEERAELFLRWPKCSVDNKGHALFLLRNPDSKFCPVLFLSKLRSASSEGPVYTLSSGKFVTTSLVNKILKQTSQLAGLPDGTAYSAHSFRAAMPTAIAQNQSTFSAAEVRAAGRWRSDAANRYVRCQKNMAESIAARAYSLNL